MNFYKLNKIIQQTAVQHSLVLDYGAEDVYEYMNTGQHKYPAVVLTVLNVTTDGITDIQTVNGTLFFIDRLTEDFSNKIQVQSVGITVLKQIFAKMQEDYSDITIENENFTTFLEKFADICGGCYCSFSISYANDIMCSGSDFEVKTINIIKNGNYSVLGYDNALVDVLPDLQDKVLNVSLNGEYGIHADSGYYGLKDVSVLVNVDSRLPEQLKSLNVSINGQYVVLPDAGKVLTSVSIDVDVQPDLLDKAVVYTENGEYTVSADSGYYGLNTVLVVVNTPGTGGEIIAVTEAEYNALAVKDPSVLYAIYG